MKKERIKEGWKSQTEVRNPGTGIGLNREWGVRVAASWHGEKQLGSQAGTFVSSCHSPSPFVSVFLLSLSLCCFLSPSTPLSLCVSFGSHLSYSYSILSQHTPTYLCLILCMHYLLVEFLEIILFILSHSSGKNCFYIIIIL